MSAGDDLKVALMESVGVVKARALVDAYAHELAEKQRAALAANPGILEHELIDVIDPEAREAADG